MSLNPQLTAVLETYGPERLYSALAWLKSEFNELLDAIDELEKPLKQPISLNELDEAVSVPLLVEFSLLQEFGLNFRQSAAFPALKQQILARIQAN